MNPLIINKSILNLDQDIVELLTNQNLSYRKHLVRLTNYSNERYELRSTTEELTVLADFIYAYLEKNV